MKNPHQQNLRKGRVSLNGQIYSISKCQFRNQNPNLTQCQGLPEMIIDAFFFCQKKEWIQLYAFVVMPDHYHILFGLEALKTLDKVLHSINSYTAQQITKNFGFETPVWQENYFDHAVRTYESLETQINYIEENPLRAGLASEKKLWPYSSAHELYALQLKGVCGC